MITPLDFPAYLNIILLIGLTIGGFFALRNGRRAELTKFQKDTIEAMQQRMDTLEDKIDDLEKTNAIQQHIIETITEALKRRGTVITIDGDMVTIAEDGGKRRTVHKRVTPPPPTTKPETTRHEAG